MAKPGIASPDEPDVEINVHVNPAVTPDEPPVVSDPSPSYEQPPTNRANNELQRHVEQRRDAPLPDTAEARDFLNIVTERRDMNWNKLQELDTRIAARDDEIEAITARLRELREANDADRRERIAAVDRNRSYSLMIVEAEHASLMR